MKKLFYFAAALPVLLVAFCLSSCDVIGGKNSGNGNDPGEGDEPGIVDETPVFVINNTLEGDWFMARRYLLTTKENGETVESEVKTFSYSSLTTGCARYIYKLEGKNRYSLTMYYWFDERHGEECHSWIEIQADSPTFEFVGKKMVDSDTGKEVGYTIASCDEENLVIRQKWSEDTDAYYEYIRTPSL